MKSKPVEEQGVVIVSAIHGMGRAAALAFAEHGARVVVSGRSQVEAG
jgi:NAD(P)-dependent dehydrogenase (short-subunit alcohol dehydrogenase family)